MSTASTQCHDSRTLLGNLLILAMLGACVGGLLTLHAGPWWLAPPRPARWWLAAAVTLAYVVACTGLMWPRRRQEAAAMIAGEPPVLVAWASQTGFATALAERSAQALRQGGRQVLLLPLDQVDAERLANTRHALFIASTTGEGDPPDHALRFLRGTMADTPALAELEYALLALGDSEYAQFCAFGRQLDEWLRHHGARPLFDRVEVDNADEASLRHWQYELGRIAGTSELADWTPPAYEPWRLVERELLNPGSQGGPAYEVRLLPASGELPAWQPGDIAEIGPRNPPGKVRRLLQQLELDGESPVVGPRGDEPLAALLARSQLPQAAGLHGISAAELAAQLHPLPHREYSIASIPQDGDLQLLVREMTDAQGQPGLGSGWLCRHTQPGDMIDLRLRSNPGFHPPAPGQALILIGNGTGLAGLRAHLHARVAAGARRNWLLFGERNADRDFFHRDELLDLQSQGWLERLDLAFSRDEGDRAYVQDRLMAAADEVRRWVNEGAAVLVCGNATGMAPGVDTALATILGEERRDRLRLEGHYRRDVY